jgi:YggT family protein
MAGCRGRDAEAETLGRFPSAVVPAKRKSTVYEGIWMIGAVADVLLLILQLYTYVVIAAVVASWLVGFGIVNSYNPIARGILRALHAMTEPVFGAIRRVLPSMGGLDLSPLIVLVAIFFLQRLIIRTIIY